jgi:hypothetical protein
MVLVRFDNDAILLRCSYIAYGADATYELS